MNALRCLQKRYLKKDDTGRVIEDAEGTLRSGRLEPRAGGKRNYGTDEAQVEETARRFFRIISSLEFLPNSPTLMNAGLELQQLSAVSSCRWTIASRVFPDAQRICADSSIGRRTGSPSRAATEDDFVKSTMGSRADRFPS